MFQQALYLRYLSGFTSSVEIFMGMSMRDGRFGVFGLQKDATHGTASSSRAVFRVLSSCEAIGLG